MCSQASPAAQGQLPCFPAPVFPTLTLVPCGPRNCPPWRDASRAYPHLQLQAKATSLQEPCSAPGSRWPDSWDEYPLRPSCVHFVAGKLPSLPADGQLGPTSGAEGPEQGLLLHLRGLSCALVPLASLFPPRLSLPHPTSSLLQNGKASYACASEVPEASQRRKSFQR